VPMETDPSKINDADRQLEAKINEAADWYAGSNARQKDENKGRAENRKHVSDLGLSTKAYQWAVQLLKSGLSEVEIKDVLRDLEIFVRVLGDRQAELFPAELAAATKRRERKAEKAAKEPRGGEELDAATDANPKSDPAAGGAGKRGRKAKAEPVEETGDELIARVAREKLAEQEQREGEALLATAGKGEPLSQSAQVAAINAKLGLS
jgi:hypothetical protein